jgi:hypothetical protein
VLVVVIKVFQGVIMMLLFIIDKFIRLNGGKTCMTNTPTRWPGEYPTSSEDAINQLHVSGEFVPGWLPKKVVKSGDPTGMYHLIFGNGQNAVVCNGELTTFRLADGKKKGVIPDGLGDRLRN